MNFDSILLGDNQFFGVNHLSPEKGKVYEERFKDLGEIKKVMYYALDNGVGGFLFSTHPAIYQITDMMRADGALKKVSLYVDVPFISKYVRMFSEQGMIGTVKTMLAGKGLWGSLRFAVESGLSVACGKYLALANRLIDVELAPFRGLNLKAVFLHTALTSLAIGYRMVSVIRNYYDYIDKRYGVIPAFDTINFPKMCGLLAAAEIPPTVVMCAVNKKGYFMNPNRAACEEAIRSTKHTILAMCTLAAGSIPPEEAYEYVFSLGNIRNVVVGLSSKQHADETFAILHRYLG